MNHFRKKNFLIDVWQHLTIWNVVSKILHIFEENTEKLESFGLCNPFHATDLLLYTLKT